MAKSVSSEEGRYIDARGSFLSQLLMLWIDRVLRFLFLTNAGGAVAVLSFMGASESVRAMAAPKWALGCFIIGLILLGILSAYQLHRSAKLNTEWRKDLGQYLADPQMRWEDLLKKDEARSHVVTSGAGYVLGYGSFLCFCVGSTIGLFLFFCN